MEGHMKRVLAPVLLAGALFGCTDASPTPQEIAKASRAKPPASEQSAQTAVVRYFAPKLKDPESARYTFRPAENGVAILDDASSGTTRHSGWFMCGTITAKNSYGDYVERTFITYFDPPTGTTVVDGTVELPGDTFVVGGWCQKLYGHQASR
jgi:hypothetical protein